MKRIILFTLVVVMVIASVAHGELKPEKMKYVVHCSFVEVDFGKKFNGGTLLEVAMVCITDSPYGVDYLMLRRARDENPFIYGTNLLIRP